VDFTIEQRLRAGVDDVQALLLDPSYVAARAELPKLGEPELVEHSVDGDQAVQRVRLRFVAQLSAAVTAVIDPSRLSWVDEATWRLSEHRADHVIVPDHYADRLRCTYSETLTTHEGGTRRVTTGTLKVRVMLAGGKVEGAIVSGLRDYAAVEVGLIDRLTTLSG
jgi:hypothetical protein